MTTELPPKPASYFEVSARQGLLMAFVLMILTVLQFMLIGSLGMSTLLLAFILGVGVYAFFGSQAIKAHRDDNLGGFISFGNAFLTAFVAILIGGIVAVLFNWIYPQWIDPGAQESILNAQRLMMEQFGADEETIDKGMEEAKVMMDNPLSALKNSLWGLFCGPLVFGSITSLILAAIMKKEETIHS